MVSYAQSVFSIGPEGCETEGCQLMGLPNAWSEAYTAISFACAFQNVLRDLAFRAQALLKP